MRQATKEKRKKEHLVGVGVAKGRKITTNQYVCYVQGGFSLDNNQLIGIIPRGGMLLLLKGSKRRRGGTSVQMYVVHNSTVQSSTSTLIVCLRAGLYC